MNTNTTAEQGRDTRFTLDLLNDAFELLERHGYAQPTEGTRARNISTAHAMMALSALVVAFEGGDQQ